MDDSNSSLIVLDLFWLHWLCFKAGVGSGISILLCCFCNCDFEYSGPAAS